MRAGPLTLSVIAVLFASLDARAAEEPRYSVDGSHAQPRDEPARPRSLEEYDQALTLLKASIAAAEKEHRWEDLAAFRRQYATLRRWRSEDTERRSEEALIGGLVAIGVGSAASVGGFATILVAAMSSVEICVNLFGGTCAVRPADSTALAAGGVLLGAGFATALIGAALAVHGGKRVMKTTVSFGPTGVVFGGTF